MWIVGVPVAVVHSLAVVMMLGRMEATPVNVALGKPTAQKGTFSDWDSSRAVDGVLQTSEDYTSCTSTADRGVKPWWVVDLIHHYHIRVVRIQNRAYFHDRLTDFYIYVSKVNPIPSLQDNHNTVGELCLHHPGTLPNGNIQQLQCDSPKNITGRYVYVWKPANDVLTMCQFEVWVEIDALRQAYVTNSHPGHVSSLTPVSTQNLSSISPVTCCIACMKTASARETTHLQINANTGLCHCIRFSEVISGSLGVSQNDDWDLWELTLSATT